LPAALDFVLALAGVKALALLGPPGFSLDSGYAQGLQGNCRRQGLTKRLVAL
jgi:hypothetical protein